MSGAIQRGTSASRPNECPTSDLQAQGSSPSEANSCDPPIHRLPPEILEEVVRYYIHPETSLQGLVRLTLVCRRWQTVIEGSALLWTTINAADGAVLVRKALKMAKDVLLDLTFHEETAQMTRQDFFKLIGERTDRWRCLSVDLASRKWDFALEELNKCIPSSLEALHLSAGYGPPMGSDVVALFGGNPAPPRLKEISLLNISISFASLQLGGLRSLVIYDVRGITSSDMLNVIRESPTIEYLRLEYLLVSPNDEAFSHQVFSPPGAFGNATVRLTSLICLFLSGISVVFLKSLLSTISAPHLKTLDIDCELQDPSIAQLLQECLHHQLSTLARLTANAQAFKVCLSSCARYQLLIGGLNLTIYMDDLPLNNSNETWDWVSNHLGRSLTKLPLHLDLVDWEPETPSRLEWFTHRVTVTKLTLSCEPYYGTASEPTIPIFSRPTASYPVIWLLPETEIIEVNQVPEDGDDDIVEMIKKRHSAEDVKDGLAAPKPFREIWLSCGGGSGADAPNPVNMEFLEEVQRVGTGADVYWHRNKLGRGG
ncbi:hypothetical protein FS837_004382 [Tulasnella sp. UAMH 9824]|nr:hypothetical protein FS837_004382 [Tulasnella sp. UAMH 9824]